MNKKNEEIFIEYELINNDEAEAERLRTQQEEDEMWQEHEYLKPVQALNVYEGLSKDVIKDLAKIVVDNVLHNGNPLAVAEQISAIELLIKEVKDSKEFKDYVREEATKHKGGYASPSGAKIELMEGGTTYNFGVCNDAVIGDLYQQQYQLKKKIAERESFLKTVKGEGEDIIYKETCEVATIYPPNKTSTSTYRVTLKK